MIHSKKDYKYFVSRDKQIMMIDKTLKKPRMFRDDCWRFVRLLRKVEYYNNCKNGLFSKIYTSYLKLRFYKLSVKLGFTIPINTFDSGIGIFHYGTIIVNHTARIGANCHIHCHTNIASNVKIGKNVFIGPGVKILNNLEIADGIRIGANSVVTKSFMEPNITIAGIPARKISDRGSVINKF